MTNRLPKRIISYILKGLLISLPLFVTGYIIYTIFSWLDGLLPVEKPFPGLGILILVVSLIALGWLGSVFIREPLVRAFEQALDRVPLIKTIYKSITDLLGAFVGSKKRFNQPVLVKLSQDLDIEVIGFITDTDLSELGSNIDGKVAVYMPMSYSFSGHLIIVPSRNITRVEKNPVDIMKYIVSGGVVEIEYADHDRKK